MLTALQELTNFSHIHKETYKGETQTPLSRNGYAYVHNNPVNFQDPSGHVGVMFWVGVVVKGVYDHHKQSKPIKKDIDKKLKDVKKQEKKAESTKTITYNYILEEGGLINIPKNGKNSKGKYVYTCNSAPNQKKISTFSNKADYEKYKELCEKYEHAVAKKTSLDIHLTFDTAGTLPIVGNGADLLNGFLYASEGKKLDAA